MYVKTLLLKQMTAELPSQTIKVNNCINMKLFTRSVFQNLLLHDIVYNSCAFGALTEVVERALT